MNLAISQLKEAIQILTRKVSDARAAMSTHQRELEQHQKVVESAEQQIHECNLAIDVLRRPAPVTAVAPDADPVPAAPKGKNKPTAALTSKG